jgi:hypothetical protein
MRTDFHNPISRDTDPITSIQGEQSVSKKGRGERAMQCLRVLATHPGVTGGEVSRHLISMYPDLSIRTCVTSPSKRLSDLERNGLACKGDYRQCTETKRNAATWFPTKQGRLAIGIPLDEDQPDMFA